MAPDYGHTHTENDIASVDVVLVVARDARGSRDGCWHVPERGWCES